MQVNIFKYLCFVLLISIFYLNLTAQDSTLDLDEIVNIKESKMALEEFLDLLIDRQAINILFNPKDIEGIHVQMPDEELRLGELLKYIFTQTNLESKIIDDQILLFKSVKKLGVNRKSTVPRFTISGYVRDGETTESLIGATVYLKGTTVGTVTNEYGFYSLTLPKGIKRMEISYVGFASFSEEIDLESDQVKNIALQSSFLEEVIVSASDGFEDLTSRSQMSQFILPIQKLKAVPVLFGEEDILKAMQLLPGVKSGAEGTSGIYVRGGSQDQNLILLDGVPVYNPAHALGIFSVFNVDAIKSVNLIKGGFPARFGGRLSSVVDIRMKEGNLDRWNGNLSLGLISSKMSLSGPLVKGKTAFLFSARRTYADVLANQFTSKEEGEETKPILFFYDFNGKIQHRINEKHRVYLSGYFGKDKFGAQFSEPFVREESSAQWGNQIMALRWNYEISSKLFANTTATYSRYNINTLSSYQSFSEQDSSVFISNYSTGINDLGLKLDVDYMPMPGHYVKFGAGVVQHRYNPGARTAIQTTSNQDLNNLNSADEIQSMEIDIYGEDEFDWRKCKVNLGIHASGFLVDSRFYHSIQPRIGLKFQTAKKWSLKASYSQMYQYINLLASEAISLPSDLWVPSTKKILPQESRLAAVGVAANLGQFNLDVEAYYKDMKNVLSYKEGATFVSGNLDNWEDKLTQGVGESYGIEFFIQKSKGRLSGWLGYTLSWTNRQFEDINGGKKYPFRYDRRHDAAIALTYSITEKIKLSANWIYGTGNAVTLPQYSFATFRPGDIYQNINYISDGSEKNSFRMSASHRLDWSISFKKEKNRYERLWVLGLYNSYYRKNPYYITVEGEYIGDHSTRTVKEHSLIPIIPTISYQLKF